jgi:ADP-ribosyl-[dinitrogen reductase] hydrolase
MMSGPRRECDNGNGAMRALPVALVVTSTDNIVERVMRQGMVTHGHVRSQLCCALYALTAAGILEALTAQDALTQAETGLRRRFVGTQWERGMELVLGARSQAP